MGLVYGDHFQNIMWFYQIPNFSTNLRIKKMLVCPQLRDFTANLNLLIISDLGHQWLMGLVYGDHFQNILWFYHIPNFNNILRTKKLLVCPQLRDFTANLNFLVITFFLPFLTIFET